MSENGVESEDFVKFLAEESGNVSTDGFFSIQVSTQQALHHCCGALATSAELHAVHAVRRC